MSDERAKRIAEAVREAAVKACSMPVHDAGHPGTAFKVQGMCLDAIRSLDLDAIIASVPGPWISVENELPDDEEVVLFRFPWDGCWQYGAGHYDEGFFCDGGDVGIGPNKTVTDWMRLQPKESHEQE